MKTQLIMLKTPVIVSDEYLKVMDWFYFNVDGIFDTLKVESEFHLGRIENHKENKKIIAGLPDLPSIDYNGIDFGIVDVKKLAYKYRTDKWKGMFSSEYKAAESGFIDGFKAAQSLNDKKFTLEDIKNAIKFFKTYQLTTDRDVFEKDINLFLGLLSQHKIFDIEIEMEEDMREKYDVNPEFDELFTPEPKITNNSIKIIKRL